MQVLMIDDDIELAETMLPVLQMYTIQLDAAYTPEEGLQKLQQTRYDLLLLDVMLPNINGFDVCRHIRQSNTPFADIPIIMLSARTELIDRVVGLETGADDYVNKPFEPRELVARIHAIRRRFKPTEPVNEYLFQLGDDQLKIDADTHQVWVNNQLLDITAMEFELIYTLAQQPGEVLSNEELITKCAAAAFSQGIVALIYRLRNKIRTAGATNDFIRTVRNKGYALSYQR